MKPFFSLLLVLSFPFPGFAQPGEGGEREIVDRQSIVEALDRIVLIPKGTSPKAARIRSREIQRIDIPSIEFQKDSTDLAGERTLEQLRELGEALNDAALADAVVTLAGHACADGDDDHNLDLSHRRAARIRDWLVSQHQIPLERLRIEGKGETEPLPGLPPESPRNRRVEVIREP